MIFGPDPELTFTYTVTNIILCFCSCVKIFRLVIWLNIFTYLNTAVYLIHSTHIQFEELISWMISIYRLLCPLVALLSCLFWKIMFFLRFQLIPWLFNLFSDDLKFEIWNWLFTFCKIIKVFCYSSWVSKFNDLCFTVVKNIP